MLARGEFKGLTSRFTQAMLNNLCAFCHTYGCGCRQVRTALSRCRAEWNLT